jgi:hypothetical protein
LVAAVVGCGVAVVVAVAAEFGSKKLVLKKVLMLKNGSEPLDRKAV